jgi:uncharacterized membrane protein YhaH (DUF805 family)
MEKGLFSVEGRIRRSAFWTRWLIGFLITFIGGMISGADESLAVLSTIIPIAVAIFIIIQGVKRMHDVNKSGWYLIIPIYNFLLALTDGTQGTNEYGDDPKNTKKLQDDVEDSEGIVKDGQEKPDKKEVEPDIKNSSSSDFSGQIVENIGKKLKKNPPPKSLGWVILFGDRPLAVNLEGECILCFSNKSKSKYFMAKYQETYYCTRPLSALSTGNINELWALLNNKSNDPDYKTPYGLIINFNYEGQQYHKYTKTDLKKIGINGLEKGLSALLQEKKSTTENDNNIATTTVKSNESQPKQPRQTTDHQSLDPLHWENYCLFCDEYESGIGVCSKIHENVRSYPKKFINKCNGKFFKKICIYSGTEQKTG